MIFSVRTTLGTEFIARDTTADAMIACTNDDLSVVALSARPARPEELPLQLVATKGRSS